MKKDDDMKIEIIQTDNKPDENILEVLGKIHAKNFLKEKEQEEKKNNKDE